MQSNFSVFEGLGFSSEGIVDIASDNQQGSVSPTKQHYINKAQELIKDVDKVHFSGEFPTVYFKTVERFDSQTLELILKVQKRIWNQGKVAFLYVESPTEIKIYNCYEKPIKSGQEDRNIAEIELFSASKQVEKDLAILRDVFGMVAIETGDFWKNQKYAQKLNHQRRVEQALIENLKKTRVALKSQGLSGVHGKTIIHDLLLRSLFILYLEDRKATNAEFYSTFKSGAKSYYDVLDDVEGTYKLFSKLEDSFNGNLSPISQEERQIVNSNHLQLIKECFWSKLKENGQMRLLDWRIFDFEVIPIELISAIYEDFLAEKEGEENQTKTGAFYTPRPLVEFILNKVLPHPSEQDHRHNVKILDPTCGSGIFLVESLNRLLDRWEYINDGKKPDFETIKQITLNNIFGVDIQADAVKVAAFSLYLAMLNRLDPKTLWPSTKFPYLIFDPKSEDKAKQGGNLFIQSSIESGDFEKIDFDLVVGNPPFSRGSLDNKLSRYLSTRNFPQEAVIAFINRAIELCSNGKIALVFAAKILFNKDRTYQNFRHFLFNETYVEDVYNFAAIRKMPKSEGGNFFESAQSPTGVLFFSKFPLAEEVDHILYCCPKNTTKYRLIDGIVVDHSDISFLPRLECKKKDSFIWKIAMWGSQRDFYFIKNMLEKTSPILKEIKIKGWLDNAESGFETSFPQPIENFELKKLPYLDAKNASRYYSPISVTGSMDFTKFYRVGNPQIYRAPHLLIKEGQSKKRFCSLVLDYDCSFRKTIYGIHSPDSTGLKLLSAFLNSKLASYILFLTTANWGVEREIVNSREALNLPSLCFDTPEDIQNQIVQLFDQIVDFRKKGLYSDDQIFVLENQIDTLFFQALNYTENERILVKDLIAYNLDAFQEKQKSIAYAPVADEENLYADRLCKTLNNFLSLGSNTTCWATVFETSSRLPLKAIAIHFNYEQAPATVINAKEAAIHETLKSIESYTYRQYSESLYFRKFVRYFTADRIYLIKPNQKRFWSQSQALNDADEIIAEILAMKK